MKNWTLLHWIPFVFFILTLTLMLLPKETFFTLTDEDGPVEWLTAGFFLLAAVTCFWLFSGASHFKSQADQQTYDRYSRRIMFLLLGLVLFFGFGEEISWGQRLLGVETPEVFREKNVQQEMNFHNLEIFNHKDHEGNVKTGFLAFFKMKRMFVLAFIFYLLILPILVSRSAWVKKLIRRFYVPVPPAWLGAYFTGIYLFFRIVRNAFPDNPVMSNNGWSEVEELNLALILFLVPVIWSALPSWQLTSRKTREAI